MTEREAQADLREAVGAMTIEFAGLEFALHNLVSAAMIDGAVARAVTEPLTFDRLVELLGRLLKWKVPRDEPMQERIRELLPRLRDVNERRSGLTHAVVGWIEGEAHFLRIRRFMGGKGELVAVEPAAVFALAEECRKLAAEVEETFKEIGERRYHLDDPLGQGGLPA